MRMMLEEVVRSIDGLRSVPGYETLAAAQTALRTLKRAPDYLVLDVVLPDGKGWELLDEDAIISGRTKVFFATGRIDEHTLSFYTRKKISGFISKISSDIGEWKDAFSCMANRSSYCSPSLHIELAKIVTNSNHWSKILTNRELEIFPYLAGGRSNQELAHKLEMAPATVQMHRKNIMRKIKVNSTPELMRWARRSGVTPT